MAKKRKRAITVKELLATKFKTFPLEGEWAESFGQPERRGSWLFYGNSGNGKTSFYLQLAKKLSQYEKVLYNSLEEGQTVGMKRAFQRHGLQEVQRRFLMLHKEPIPELAERLRKPRSANVIFIDSIQYAELDKRSYLKFVNEFPDKLFIWTSHREGNYPEGRLARFVHYDSHVKGCVEGYMVDTISRGFETKPFIVWEEGAQKYYGVINE